MHRDLSDMTLVPISGTGYGFFAEKKLGEGYGGTIYEGIRVHDSSSIAVKILNPASLI